MLINFVQIFHKISNCKSLIDDGILTKSVKLRALSSDFLANIEHFSLKNEKRLLHPPTIIRFLLNFPPNKFIPSPAIINNSGIFYPIPLFHPLLVIGSQE